ncbi:MAG: hypothetical protein ACRCWF_18865 [Beijerinckiaceae bacterium]
MRARTGLAAISFALLATPALSQEIRLGDIRAHVYLEASGKLSDDLLTIKNASLNNLPRGEGAFGEPANTVIFNVGLLGAKNSQPKFASALVNITTTNRTGQKKTETRPLMGFVFGEDGKVNRPIVLDNITCSKVEIEVKARGASKRASLDFSCTDPKTADASDKTTPKAKQ